MHRRTFIRRTAAFAGATAVMSIVPRKAFAAGTPTMVNSIRSLSNPYHATWNQGGRLSRNRSGPSMSPSSPRQIARKGSQTFERSSPRQAATWS